MHDAAFQWVARFRSGDPLVVLDIGGRNINGTCRSLFPAAEYVALDIAPGNGVDIVADAASWQPDRLYDVVVCAEVFEHTPDWVLICGTAIKALRIGGLFIATCAGPGRAPHSAVDGGRIRPGEHYANVDPADMLGALKFHGFVDVEVDQSGEDVRAVAHR